MFQGFHNIHPFCLEKIEDAKAKAAIKAQIEADKKARAEKAAREKALRDGQPLPEASGSANPPRPATTAAPTSGMAGKDFKETRLQIRLSTGGQPYTTTLSSDACKSNRFLFRAVSWQINSFVPI
jgi:hypothetical protein